MLNELYDVFDSFADKFPDSTEDKFEQLEKMKGAAGYTDQAT